MQTRLDQFLNTDFAKENQSLKNEVKELRSTNKSLSEENGRLKSAVEHLTNEIESLYVLTKDFLKARTSDLESFKELFGVLDRKSTRLNSSHVAISYAVFCLKKKNPEEERFMAEPAYES